MKKIKKTTSAILLILASGFLIAACNGGHNAEKTAAAAPASEAAADSEKQLEIIGKTGTIAFPEFKVDETFVSDSILHWKIIDEKGQVIEGDEKVSFKRLNDHQFFVNWIEKTGLTVSQVLDIKNKTATAFVSREDKKSDRGQRSANFFEGSFEIKK
jgi:hypothetical protein